ncbi:MAG: hypothetical protein DI498_15180 [Paracoccus denitrificans]|nr:MAG: hypothetical protein DI498_15180 [Paracoccus denitrificans]PZO82093.1 MAG: hypothetical protein DI633_15180 [Paracoccus denitrificans]
MTAASDIRRRYERVASLTATGPVSAAVRDVAVWALGCDHDDPPDPGDLARLVRGGFGNVRALNESRQDLAALTLNILMMRVITRSGLCDDMSIAEMIGENPDGADRFFARVADAFTAAIASPPARGWGALRTIFPVADPVDAIRAAGGFSPGTPASVIVEPRRGESLTRTADLVAARLALGGEKVLRIDAHPRAGRDVTLVERFGNDVAWEAGHRGLDSVIVTAIPPGASADQLLGKIPGLRVVTVSREAEAPSVAASTLRVDEDGVASWEAAAGPSSALISWPADAGAHPVGDEKHVRLPPAELVAIPVYREGALSVLGLPGVSVWATAEGEGFSGVDRSEDLVHGLLSDEWVGPVSGDVIRSGEVEIFVDLSRAADLGLWGLSPRRTPDDGPAPCA